MIKVFRLKDLIKYSISVTIPLIVIMLIVRLFFYRIKLENSQKVSTKGIIQIMNNSIDLLRISKLDNSKKNIAEWGKVILDSEFGVFNEAKNEDEMLYTELEDEIEEDGSKNEVEKNSEENNDVDKNEIVQAKTDVNVEVIPNKVKPNYNTEFNNIKINNSTDYELTDELLNLDGVEINKNKVIIYHTHTCESYTPTEQYWYEGTGNFRTTDLDYSVVRVGEELKSQLESYGCEVIHDKTLHDYPAYNGSYSRSLKTVQNIINENKDVDIVIDLHRDAIADSSYAPKVKIGEELVSQLLFVIGTDKANPEHTSWSQNLKFAVKAQTKSNSLYPGLFKPIILRNSTYNQNVAKAACIIEVGATGNTLEESMNSMKYLAKVLQEM